MKSTESEQNRWFTEEVQPHESLLRAWLHSKFPSLTDIDDLTQEAYARIFRAKRAGKIRYAKALLFTTARNIALDLFRRKKTAPIDEVTDFQTLSVLDNGLNVAETVSRQQELELLANAFKSLPERCREVMGLRYHEGLAYKEIAKKLGISPETVKTQVAKGMRRCAEYYEERGLINSRRQSDDVAL